MSSEEEDYMSEKFLAGCTSDVRPGLVRNRAKEREIQVATKKARISEHQKLNSKPASQERLEQGLNNPLTSTNKGFALLAKMGYKEGESLGKSTTSGIIEPIGITVKLGRAGFGRQAALVELADRTQELRKKKQEAREKGVEITTEQFRKRMVQKAEERFIESTLVKCQKACEKLDEQDKYDFPVMKWFWPDRNTDSAKNKLDGELDEEIFEEDEEVDEYEPAEKLEMLTNYMRTTYNYCHWCGVHYDSNDDLNDNCPGPYKDDH